MRAPRMRLTSASRWSNEDARGRNFRSKSAESLNVDGERTVPTRITKPEIGPRYGPSVGWRLPTPGMPQANNANAGRAPPAGCLHLAARNNTAGDSSTQVGSEVPRRLERLSRPSPVACCCGLVAKLQHRRTIKI